MADNIKILGVNEANNLPDPVRARLAANLTDPGTPEGSALSARIVDAIADDGTVVAAAVAAVEDAVTDGIAAGIVTGRLGVSIPQPTSGEIANGDWAPAINRAFNDGGIVRLPPGEGAIPVKSTVFIPDGHELHGTPDSWLELQTGHDLTELLGYPRREAGGAVAIVTNVQPTTGKSQNVAVRNLRVVGDVGNQVLEEQYLQHGILFLDAENFIAEHVEVTDINHDPDLVPPAGWSQAYGFGIAAVRSAHGKILDAFSERSGYENFAIYDECEDLDIVRVRSGEAWRTGFQVHRSCSDIRVDGLRVRQTNSKGSAITVHSNTALPITGLRMRGIDAESAGNYGIEFVDAACSFSEFSGRVRAAGHTGIYMPTGSDPTAVEGSEHITFRDMDVSGPIRAITVSLRDVSHVTLVGGLYDREGATTAGSTIWIEATGPGQRLPRVLDLEARNPNGTAVRMGGVSGSKLTRPVIRGVRTVATSNGILFANNAVEEGMVYGNDLTQSTLGFVTDTTGHEVFGNQLPA